jgi:hypothetical protein
LKKVNNWLPKEFTTVKYIALSVKEE